MLRDFAPAPGERGIAEVERLVARLPALRAAYTATGNPAAFPAYIADLRLRHKRRPTFLKTLDAASV